MANYTLSPSPWQTFLYPNGAPIVGGQLFTYQAGQGPAATTYRNSSGTPNTNPIILDATGSASIFLAPGSYYFALFDAAVNGGAFIKDQDNISAVPASAQQTIANGIAGQTLAAGQVAYLSDGSGALTSGRWYLAQANNAYSSTTPEVGFVLGAANAGSPVSIIEVGNVTGLTVTVGLRYYIDPSTPGAITSSSPALSRYMGQADSGTSIVSGRPPLSVTIDNSVCDFRITGTTVTPVTTADVSNITSLFITPYTGNRMALYDGLSAWSILTSAEITQALGTLTANLPYDVFAFNNSGTIATEILAWTSATARATALVLQDGVLVKSGVTTRRYLGTFYTTSTTQTQDTAAQRLVWNYYNRVARPMRVLEPTDSWAYSTNTWRQARATATNQLEFLIGVAEVALEATVIGNASSNNPASQMWVGIGEDSTTAPDASCLVGVGLGFNVGFPLGQQAQLKKYPAIGRHLWVWLEKANTGTITWYGDNGADGTQSGIHGSLLG